MVILSDWYHEEYSVLIKEFLSSSNPDGVEPIPDSGLIYFAQNGRYLGPIPGKNPPSHHDVRFNENATLPFEPGKTYRLRIINMGAFAAFFFWINGHDMTIIKADSMDVQESPIDILSIAVAQRYSLIVTARNDADSNWAIHANLDTAMFDTVPSGLQPNITASITYKPYAPIIDLGFVDAYHDVNDTALVPIVADPMLPKTQTIELEVSFGTVWDGTNRGMFNGIYYVPPDLPSVLRVFQLGPNAMNQSAYGNSSFVIPHLTALEIVLKNGDTGGHPFHLHGHKVQIVGRAENYTSSDPTLNPSVVEGQENPMRRDTVQVPAGSSVTLRLIADNPGAWIFHCHIQWHLQAGLAATFIEAPLEMEQRARTVQAPPKALAAQCCTQIPNLPVSSHAAGYGG
ncbi:multicopper oxidase-domain-containing protein [Russula dissimulans]|nr:multicopper oxidase-domain-containing protein [Russula dissimulans]